MGRAMAANLVEAGHQVRVWNRSRQPVEELVRKGAEAVAEPEEAFGEVLISMPADDAAGCVGGGSAAPRRGGRARGSALSQTPAGRLSRRRRPCISRETWISSSSCPVVKGFWRTGTLRLSGPTWVRPAGAYADMRITGSPG
jgi:NAD binding domain of 6-phosphogluconate dehydrogenase